MVQHIHDGKARQNLGELLGDSLQLGVEGGIGNAHDHHRNREAEIYLCSSPGNHEDYIYPVEDHACRNRLQAGAMVAWVSENVPHGSLGRERPPASIKGVW